MSADRNGVPAVRWADGSLADWEMSADRNLPRRARRAQTSGPMILTSNQSFSAWGDVFGDRIIATAILDRLLHHAVTLNIRGNSYRLKDKLKAGLIRTQDDDGSQPGGEI